jgi:hypothetical protein
LDNPHTSNPSTELAPGTAILGDSGRRLAELIAEVEAGYSPTSYRSDFDRVNLYPARQATNGKGATKMDRAMAQWCAMYATLGEYQNVVLLGNRVKVAFADLLEFEADDAIQETTVTLDDRRVSFYVVPHPSGRNKFYNDKASRKSVGALLASLRERRKQERAK